MGTLLGHALPGSFFLLFALWRMIQINIRLHVTRLLFPHRPHRPHEGEGEDDAPRYFTSATYPCCVGGTRFPLEGVTKIVVTSVGMAGELFASTDYGHARKIVSTGDLQHVTMYGLFCISGIVDVLTWKRVRFCPPGIDYLTLALAFAGEWVLFSHHLGGRTELDVTLHTLLLLVVAGTVVAVIAEYRWNGSLIASLGTAYLLLLQGTWFVQVGVVLYGKNRWSAWLLYELEESDQVTMATVLFAWHAAVDFVGGLMLYSLMGYSMSWTSCRRERLEVLWEAQVMSSSVPVDMTPVVSCRVMTPSSTDTQSDAGPLDGKRDRSSDEDHL